MVDFIQLVGIPPAIHSDDTKVFQHGDFKSTCRKYQAQHTFTDPYSPWQNRAEGANRKENFMETNYYECMTHQFMSGVLYLNM